MKIYSDFLNITNVLLMPEGNDKRREQSPFQGFLLSLFDQEYFDLIEKFCFLPQHALEIFLTSEELINHRHVAERNTILLSVDLFVKNMDLFVTPVTVIFFHSGQEKYIFEIKERSKFLPILIGNGDLADLKVNDLVNSFSLDEMIKSRLENISNENPEINEFISGRGLRQLDKRVKVNIAKAYHGVTVPNDLLLENLGFDYDRYEPLKPSGSPESSYSAIKLVVDEVVDKLFSEGRVSDSKSGIIIYSTAMFSYLYKSDYMQWNKILRETKEKSVRDAIKNGLIKNKFYSGFSIKFEGDPKKIFNDKLFKAVNLLRKGELMLTNFGITLLALDNNCPAVRLPNAVNQHIAKLRHIEQLSQRNDEKGRVLLQREVGRLSDLVKSDIPEKILTYLQNPPPDMKLCLEFPLEWIRFSDVPLMFNSEVSRLSVTPGNMFLQNAAMSKTVYFQEKDLLRILVIRSFDDKDRLKDHLEFSIRHYSELDENYILDVNFVDVKTKEELIKCLNTYEGMIVVFDCHGNHGGFEGAGWLCVGNEKVDTWTLAGIAKIPPIVILSACLTYPIAGSHASIAAGFLRSGALTVIGTFLPVDSIKSAIFVARILYRINSFIPALKKIKITSVSWRKLVSDFLKMSYTTDILRYFLENKKLLSDIDYSTIHVEINAEINSQSEGWFNKLIFNISVAANTSEEEVKSIVKNELALTETMYYVQIGNPEKIIIDLAD